MSNLDTSKSSPSVREINGSTAADVYRRRAIAPPVDVFENEEEYLLVADVPGVPANGINLTLENNTLTLQAHRATSRDASPALAREYDEADFATTFRIPAGIDSAAIVADTKNGALFVHLPKAAAAKPRKITVR